MPKLVYIHEGIDQDKSSKKRKVLKYVLNNWDGIEIKADKGYEII